MAAATLSAPPDVAQLLSTHRPGHGFEVARVLAVIKSLESGKHVSVQAAANTLNTWAARIWDSDDFVVAQGNSGKSVRFVRTWAGVELLGCTAKGVKGASKLPCLLLLAHLASVCNSVQRTLQSAMLMHSAAGFNKFAGVYKTHFERLLAANTASTSDTCIQRPKRSQVTTVYT
jgi:hypothetical protein